MARATSTASSKAKLRLLDFLRHHTGQLLADRNGLAASPLDAVSVWKKPMCLLSGGHVETFSHNLPDQVRETIGPPITGQAEIGQFM